MGVGVEGDAIGAQFANLGQRSLERHQGLERQAVDKVNVDRRETQRARCRHQLEHLARRLDAYRGDPIILGDRDALKESIPNLQRRLAQENDERVRGQLETTLGDQQRLQVNIAELDNRMQRADLQLDSSLASLGTVYSQLLLIGSKDVDGGQAERLQADISDEVNSLQDVVASINEIYDYQTFGPGR